MSLESRKRKILRELRREGIDDQRVLEAMAAVPREDFVAADRVPNAYDNVALPIELGQTISQPLIVALMTQHLRLNGDHEVLEIGTGSGYQAAILAALCRRVYTIERHATLLRTAESRFSRLGFDNIMTRSGDGSKGWPEAAPFDRIIVTAAAREVPPALMKQIPVGGMMVLPLCHGFGDQELVVIGRGAQGYDRKSLIGVRFVPLVVGDNEGEAIP